MWARPSNSRVAHAFDSESRSLCGKWFLPAAKDVGRREPPDAPCCAACARAFAASPRSADPPVPAPPSPEPRRPVAGWEVDEVRFGGADVVIGHLRLDVFHTYDRGGGWTWEIQTENDAGVCIKRQAAADALLGDRIAAQLAAEDAAALLLDAANAALGRKP